MLSGDEVAKSYELKNQFFFHHVNAFEREETGEVCLDSIPLEVYGFLDELRYGDSGVLARWIENGIHSIYRQPVEKRLETGETRIPVGPMLRVSVHESNHGW